MALIQQLLSSDKYNVKCPYAMKASGICVHISNNNISAKNEVSLIENDTSFNSCHIIIDDFQAIQIIPFNRNSWPTSNDPMGIYNRRYIHVKICYGKSKKLLSSSKKKAAKEIALLLKQYGWNIFHVKEYSDFNIDCFTDTEWLDFLNMIQSELGGKELISRSMDEYKYRIILEDFDSIDSANIVLNKLKESGINVHIEKIKK